MMAFTTSASPFVTSRQALEREGQRVHITGTLVKNSIQRDIKTGALVFSLTDTDGTKFNVVHRGDPPTNMGTATSAVVIGTMKGGLFNSDQLLLKCPSKYEGEQDILPKNYNSGSTRA